MSLRKLKITLLIFIVVVLLVISVIVWQKYPFRVQRYKTIALGMQAAEKAGDSTGWAPPYDRVPEESEFFVYSLGDKGMCIQSDCGMGGYFIECLRGWISAAIFRAARPLSGGAPKSCLDAPACVAPFQRTLALWIEQKIKIFLQLAARIPKVSSNLIV